MAPATSTRASGCDGDARRAAAVEGRRDPAAPAEGRVERAVGPVQRDEPRLPPLGGDEQRAGGDRAPVRERVDPRRARVGRRLLGGEERRGAAVAERPEPREEELARPGAGVVGLARGGVAGDEEVPVGRDGEPVRLPVADPERDHERPARPEPQIEVAGRAECAGTAQSPASRRVRKRVRRTVTAGGAAYGLACGP